MIAYTLCRPLLRPWQVSTVGPTYPSSLQALRTISTYRLSWTFWLEYWQFV